ncbi:MAG: pyruvate dehydrogenase complex dihydrolipoamide acetyltransferase [Verrucomicrobiales bacterium]
MPTVIKMPKLSDTMTEGTLLKWKIKKGDKVEMGEIIAEVETDKATMEMEAFDDGVVHELYVNEGGKVPVGAKMVLLVRPGEDPNAAPAEDGPADAPAAPAPAKAAAPAAAASKAAAGVPAPKAAAAAVPGARVKASPLARKIAAEKGINLATVTGTGPGGRIIASDVESARPSAASGPVAVAGLPAPILPRVGEKDEVLPVSNMRKIIADRLLASKLQLPHFYLRLEVDAGPLMALREQVNASETKREGGNKYTINDFILKAVVSALQAVPAVNASWNGDSIVRYASIGLSVAISVEDGLVTPVVKQAETKSLIEISRAVKDLAVRARDKKLKPDEFDGGTITVSNLGAWGIDHFDAIINPPQASILSVGAIKEQPVVKNGQIVVGRRMWLGLSCDHRVVDGAVAAEFLAAIAHRVEQPALMLV